MKQLKKLVAQILMLFLATTFSACAEVYKKPCKEPCSGPQTHDKFAYTLQFNEETGKLNILNEKKELLRPARTNFPKEPLPVKAIINVHTIIEAKGSCILIVDNEVFNVCRR